MAKNASQLEKGTLESPSPWLREVVHSDCSLGFKLGTKQFLF